MPQRAAFLLACAVGLLTACDAPTDPDPGSAFLGRWEMIPVDSGPFTLIGAGITPSGTVIGSVIGEFVLGAPTGAAFRWTNGKFEFSRYEGFDLRVTAINDSGDAVGVTGL